jgi:hypothetical protein
MFPKPEAELQVLLAELMACPQEKHAFMPPNPVPGVLVRIGQHGNPAALPWMLHLIHSTSEEVRVAAEQLVGALLPKLEGHQLIELEQLVRESWEFYSRDYAYRAKTDLGACLATLDSSGWIRERAVLALQSSGATEALPFVLLRSNDWVAQVRKAAERWFSAHGAAITMEQLVASLPILAALTERTYGNVSKLVKVLLERLALPEAAPGLLAVLPRSSSRIRRLLFTMLAQNGTLQDPDAQSVLLKHPDPIFGVLLLKHLRLHSPELPMSVVTHSLSSKSATLRRYALYALSEKQISHLTPLLWQSCFDFAQGVRNFAQYHLLKHFTSEELQARYAALLREPHVRNAMCAACILGFHEAGGKWEATHYLELSHHKSTQVRVAVLRTFAATCFDDALPWLKNALVGDKASLGKAALAILRQHRHAVSLIEINSMLGQDHPPVVRLRAFVLLCMRNRWEQLPVLFELLNDPSRLFESQVLLRLSGWLSQFNQVHTRPTRTQVEQALTALDRAGDRMGPRLNAEFRALLRSVAPG